MILESELDLDQRLLNLECLNEHCTIVQQLKTYNLWNALAYNSMVQPREFKKMDIVLRVVFHACQGLPISNFAAWLQRPFEIRETHHASGYYWLSNLRLQ